MATKKTKTAKKHSAAKSRPVKKKKRRKLSASHVRGHVTRRKNAALAAAKFAANSARSRKGWETKRRRLNPLPAIAAEAIRFRRLIPVEDTELWNKILIDLFDESLAEIKARPVTTLAQMRLLALRDSSFLHGSDTGSRDHLASMIRNRDSRFADFLEMAEMQGFDMEEIRNSWFSPEV
jgi:hypothetical protein